MQATIHATPCGPASASLGSPEEHSGRRTLETHETCGDYYLPMVKLNFDVDASTASVKLGQLRPRLFITSPASGDIVFT